MKTFFILSVQRARYVICWSFQFFFPINAEFLWQHLAYTRTALLYFIKSNMTQTNSFAKLFVPKFHARYFGNSPPPQNLWTESPYKPTKMELRYLIPHPFFRQAFVLYEVTSNEKSHHHLKVSTGTLSSINTSEMTFFSSRGEGSPGRRRNLPLQKPWWVL